MGINTGDLTKSTFVYYIFFKATLFNGLDKEGGVVIDRNTIISSQEDINTIQADIARELPARSVVIQNIVLLAKK